MQPTHKFLRTAITLIGVISMLVSALQIQPQPVLAQGKDGIQRDYNTETGKVSRITGTGNEPITVMGAMSADMSPEQRSDVLVERFAPEFGLTSPSEELTLADESQPDANRTVTKYQQVYQGVPVLGGELIVNAGSNGELYSMNGEVSQGIDLKATPTVTKADAKNTALQIVIRGLGGSQADYIVSEPELWIYDESLLKPSDRPVELVWRMEVTAADNSGLWRELVLVNAHT